MKAIQNLFIIPLIWTLSCHTAENNQQEDGSVLIPEALHKYLNGLTVLRPE